MSICRNFVQVFLLLLVKCYFSSGSNQVYVVFDNPGGLPDSPKAFEKQTDSVKVITSIIMNMCFSLMNVLHSGTFLIRPLNIFTGHPVVIVHSPDLHSAMFGLLIVWVW